MAKRPQLRPGHRGHIRPPLSGFVWFYVGPAGDGDLSNRMGKKRAPSSKPLFQAIEEGDLNKVQDQIATGVNVNAFRRDDGYTPLGLAIENGNVEIARVLLHAGADANGGGVVPLLRQAICSRNEALVRLLLEFGANANARDEDRWTPLMHAAAAGNLDVIKLLRANGADPRVADILTSCVCSSIEARI